MSTYSYVATEEVPLYGITELFPDQIIKLWGSIHVSVDTTWVEHYKIMINGKESIAYNQGEWGKPSGNTMMIFGTLSEAQDYQKNLLMSPPGEEKNPPEKIKIVI